MMDKEAQENIKRILTYFSGEAQSVYSANIKMSEMNDRLNSLEDRRARLIVTKMEEFGYRKLAKGKPPLLTLEQCAVIDQNHPMPIQLKRMKLLNKYLKAQRKADIKFYEKDTH